MKIRFLLKRKGQTRQIFLALYQGDQTELIYTGERITLKEWSNRDRLPKDQTGTVYKAIKKVEAAITRAMHQLDGAEKPVTPFTVRQAYKDQKREKDDSQLAKDKVAKAGVKSVSLLASQWTECNLFGYKKSTQKAVKESITQFTDYLKVSGQTGIERKDLGEDTIDGYARYLLEKKKLADSTHGKRIKHLRWFLKSIRYDVQGIKIRTGKKKIIALTLDELVNLEAVDVSFDADLQKAKDMYLLGCYTGQRISDVKRFNATNTANGFITLSTVKSGGKIEVKIPIGKTVRDILSRYGNSSPKISEADLNLNIKTVCEKADITQYIEVETSQGGQTISKTVKKYSQISSHTAGKTFISTVAPEIYKLTPAETAGVVGKSLKTLLSHYYNLPAESGRSKMIEVEGRKTMEIAN